jgi:hypothetical protein
MEIILAIVVAVAVIFFGALISMGNERQRKAIDELREQVGSWAIQDLKIKRNHMSSEIVINDPLIWFNQVTAKYFGSNLDMQFIEKFDNPSCLIFLSRNTGSTIVFSFLSAKEVQLLKNSKQGKLSQYGEQNPLITLPHQVESFEMSVLNCGVLFDLELSLAWKMLTGIDIGQAKSLWLYKFS